MLNSLIVLQVQTPADVIAPWELPPIYWVGSLALDFVIIALVWIWARSGRSKREKNTPFHRGAENFANTVQAGYGAIPTFMFVVYGAVILTIITYTVISILSGTQY